MLRPGIFLRAMDPWILGVGYLSISRSHPQASFTTPAQGSLGLRKGVRHPVSGGPRRGAAAAP